MGIKGIYRELGPGQRVSLAKLAVEHLKSNGRPFRIAVDIAIWQYQAQAAKGGSNPAIRTLFYRLVRLLGHTIQPIFVFDGPNKPAFKRNKRSGRGDSVGAATAKQLIKLFGFPIHQAPGEAEAECALLQQEGVVDAVLSEDVDTLMFGCTRTLRSWSPEGGRGSKAPTHVTIYELNERNPIIAGLGRDGMVLVALMSGGDYIPEGVSGCGVKLACEIARAGFGKELCRLRLTDQVAIADWRANLKHELLTNESGFFRTRHKALVIPDTFPDPQVLRHYTHPAVSPREVTKRLMRTVEWTTPVDLDGLRIFVNDTFDWTHRDGAVKLMRVLSPSLLAQRLMHRSGGWNDTPSRARVDQGKSSLILTVTGERSHWSVDGMPELRVSYLPSSIVPIDLLKEEVVSVARQGIALNSDDEFGTPPTSRNHHMGTKHLKPGGGFDPSSPQPAWVPEYLVGLGAPLVASGWKNTNRVKSSSKPGKKSQGGKGPLQNASNGGTGKPNSLEQWLRTSKAPAPSQEEVSVKKQQKPTLTGPSIPPPSILDPIFSFPHQHRMLHTKTISNRSKIPKSPAKAAITDLTEPGDPRALDCSQILPRDVKPTHLEQSPVLSSGPQPAWASSTSPLMKCHEYHSETIASSRQSSELLMRRRRPQSATSPSRQNQPEPPNSSTAEPRKHEGQLKQTRITTYLRVASQNDSSKPCGEHDPEGSSPWTSGFVKPQPSGSLEPPKSPKLRTKLLIQDPSTPGFLREVEVSEDEAFALLDNDHGGMRVTARRAWRHSSVSLIDLTDDAWTIGI